MRGIRHGPFAGFVGMPNHSSYAVYGAMEISLEILWFGASAWRADVPVGAGVQPAMGCAAAPAILVQTTVLRPVSQPRLLATRWLPPGCEPGGAVGQVRPLRQDVTKYALYTTTIFVGGAAGSAIASSLYGQGGWGLIMQVGSAVALVGLVVFILLRRR